jgi:hypothetical protein
MLKILSVMLVLFGSSVALADGAQDNAGFEGIYEGHMDLQIGNTTRRVPLQISLVLTGETVVRPNGDIVQVIDGAFLVDGEGGAFPFARVRFDLSNFSLDMRYSRPMMEMGNETPSSFRLVGDYHTNGTVTGRVLSGNRGPIGQFEVKHTNQAVFARTDFYQGKWAGHADLSGGGEIPMSLELVDAQGATTNPPVLEFDYTPGKLGNIHWNNLNFSIRDITIDYLLGIISMRVTGPTGSSDLSIEFEIEQNGDVAKGTIKSAYRGNVASFILPKAYN